LDLTFYPPKIVSSSKLTLTINSRHHNLMESTQLITSEFKIYAFMLKEHNVSIERHTNKVRVVYRNTQHSLKTSKDTTSTKNFIELPTIPQFDINRTALIPNEWPKFFETLTYIIINKNGAFFFNNNNNLKLPRYKVRKINKFLFELLK